MFNLKTLKKWLKENCIKRIEFEDKDCLILEKPKQSKPKEQKEPLK